MPISSEAGYITAKAAGVYRRFQKASIANAVAGTIHSLWRSTGPLPVQPAIPGAAAVCDRTTAGALDLPAVAGGNARYIETINGVNTTGANILLVDRLIQSGGLNGTLITAQSVNTPALPARGPAAGCEWFLECYTDLGGTTTTATCAVTFTDTTTANIAVTVPATWRAGRLLPIVPPTGKVIASLQNMTLTASTLAAGNFGVTAHQHTGAVLTPPTANIADKEVAMLLQVATDACLAQIVDCTTTSTGDVRGGLRLIEG